MEAIDRLVKCEDNCPDACTPCCNDCDYGAAYEEGAKAQDEISFKAGMKKVVEWVKSHGDWDCGHFIFGFDIDQDIWDAQLKEWGIEEVKEQVK